MILKILLGIFHHIGLKIKLGHSGMNITSIINRF